MNHLIKMEWKDSRNKCDKKFMEISVKLFKQSYLTQNLEEKAIWFGNCTYNFVEILKYQSSISIIKILRYF